jgi:Cyclin
LTIAPHVLSGAEFRFALAALGLANKILDDNTYTARTWSDISGLPIDDINQTERHFLSALDFDLYVSEKAFSDWLSVLDGLRVRREEALAPPLPALQSFALTPVVTGLPCASIGQKRSASTDADAPLQPLKRRALDATPGDGGIRARTTTTERSVTRVYPYHYAPLSSPEYDYTPPPPPYEGHIPPWARIVESALYYSPFGVAPAPPPPSSHPQQHEVMSTCSCCSTTPDREIRRGPYPPTSTYSYGTLVPQPVAIPEPPAAPLLLPMPIRYTDAVTTPQRGGTRTLLFPPERTAVVCSPHWSFYPHHYEVGLGWIGTRA